MIILTLGSSWYLSIWSMKVVPGYLSPPIAIPSYTPFVFSDMMLFNSLDMPPDRETYATLLGRDEFSRFKVHSIRTYFLQKHCTVSWNSIPYLPGLKSLDARMLSNIPPVFPILKQPGFTPPTWNEFGLCSLCLKSQNLLWSNGYVLVYKWY